MTREVGDAIRPAPGSVVTTGTFDGVHRGHQAIIRYLVDRARRVGGVPTVVTFDPHPREVLTGQPVPLLTTLDERADLLEALGVERFVVVPFSRDLSLLEPEDYVADVLVGRIGMREIVIGYDHRFGRKARGDQALLERLGGEHGFSVDVIPKQVEGDVTVSSTEIRRLLADAGDAARAAVLLGRPYRITGTVVHGDARGRGIGFPTANVEPANDRKLVPAIGVYAVRATLPGGAQAAGAQAAGAQTAGAVAEGMMNVGRRPTFEADGATRAEVHLFDTDADLYGRRLAVDVVARLRGERRFDGVDALVAQLGQDREAARAVLAAPPPTTDAA
ncbi:bifunctional riboflavin kinase/FAD synthetase [Rubrivirga sp. S365]|uniref:Riboflavin biosynthesis protein n=1 Tax=Rubrivirga litoralis TaxID=3075598 RepID=A0ABU3BUW5_9BACT|nr:MULTISPECIES: bifunctional riboflavin kinase/FAD synthetase [unclassified Rubrivirga]MDT0633084.1 bifunctional riboflavin kinase/FAD synthetase [Rubrivirga sp. F394]MDT7856916.1 bifunctional riboflavin kinase/FAD synthetase [Rubrivirga sp. S365]